MLIWPDFSSLKSITYALSISKELIMDALLPRTKDLAKKAIAPVLETVQAHSH